MKIFICLTQVLLISTALGNVIYVDTSDGTTPPGYLYKGPNSQGWVMESVGHVANTNYYTGLSSTGTARSFFTFLFPTIGGTVTSAILELTRFEYRSSAAFEIVDFYDADSNPADVFAQTYRGGIPLPVLDAETQARVTRVYNDLGSGILYGAMEIRKEGHDQDVLSCVLNQYAVDRINTCLGTHNYFIIGGALRTLDGSVSEDVPSAEAVFSGSGAEEPWAVQRLVLVGDFHYVPAPGAILLGTFGAGLVGLLRRRRVL